LTTPQQYHETGRKGIGVREKRPRSPAGLTIFPERWPASPFRKYLSEHTCPERDLTSLWGALKLEFEGRNQPPGVKRDEDEKISDLRP
jgi:hypothetical protein